MDTGTDASRRMNGSWQERKKNESSRCTTKGRFRINRKLLPIKAFYFMLNAALASLAPYILLYIKSQGLSSGETGILFGVMPFIAFLAQPAIGLIADRWRKHKVIMMVSSLITGLFHLLMITVPARQRHDVIMSDVTVTCSSSSILLGLTYCEKGDSYHCGVGSYVESVESLGKANYSALQIAEKCDSKTGVTKLQTLCLNNLLNPHQNRTNDTSTSVSGCKVLCPSQSPFTRVLGRTCFTNNPLNVFHNVCNVTRLPSFPNQFTIQSMNGSSMGNETHTLYSTHGNANADNVSSRQCVRQFAVSGLNVDGHSFDTISCEPEHELRCSLECQLSPGDPCAGDVASFDLTFWLLFVFYFVAFIAVSPLIPMSDAVCYSVLKDEWRKYGQQRVWGTIGWMAVAVAFTVGVYFVDELDYAYTFYFFGGLMAVCACIPYFIDLPVDIRCGNMLRNMGKVLVLPKVVALLVMALLFGMQCGALSFILWYLEDLGAPPTIFGPFNVMGVLTEVPAFYLVSRVIHRFGPVRCITFSMLLMSLRLLGYALLGNPWLVLLIEPLHGPVMGPMLAGCTTYITWVSPPGMSATSQGLLGGVLQSLGRSFGVILTGWLFDVVGARVTWAIYAGAGVAYALLYAFLNCCVFTEKMTPPVQDKEAKITENGDILDLDTHPPLMMVPEEEKYADNEDTACVPKSAV